MTDEAIPAGRVRYHWARIGDGNYEPVAVTGRKGKRMAYTIGCPDPFPVDVEDSAILLATDEFDKMTPPLTPKQEAAALARERRFRAIQASHRYAGFGR